MLPPSISSTLAAIAEVLLPERCALCAQPPREGPFCLRCLPDLTRPEPEPPPPSLLSWEAAVPYQGEWREWIRRFKFPQPGLLGLDPAADAVAVWLACRAANQIAPSLRPDLIVPVPLHPRRLRERGFDQAAILARAVARQRQEAPWRPLLARRIDTQRQTDLSRAERAANVRGAFYARGEAPPCIWLIDDVATTGSTLREAARALRDAGAETVVGVSAARTPRGVSDEVEAPV